MAGCAGSLSEAPLAGSPDPRAGARSGFVPEGATPYTIAS
jgi:hypothetical protein